MPIETLTLIPEKLFLHKIEGYIVIPDIKAYQDAFWVNHKNLAQQVNAIWDLRNANMSNLSFETVDHYAENVKATKFIPYKPGLTAVLMNDTPEKHLVTYLSNLMQGVHDRELELFTNYDEAFDYVTGSLKQVV